MKTKLALLIGSAALVLTVSAAIAADMHCSTPNKGQAQAASPDAGAGTSMKCDAHSSKDAGAHSMCGSVATTKSGGCCSH